VNTRRRGRALGITGAVLGAVSMAYLLSTWVDGSTASWLHNPSARRADLTYGAVALVTAFAVLILFISPLRRTAVVGSAVGALLYGTAGLNAIESSERHDRLASAVVLVVPALVLMVAAALRGSSALTRPSWRGPVIVSAALALAAFVLTFTWAEGPIEEHRIFAGLLPSWHLERRVDHVIVDEADNAWGFLPWEETETVTASLLDRRTDTFEALRERAASWPPIVLGTDVSDATWLVGSDASDPFEPVVETFRDGRFTRIPAPDVPLPPLDAVALDRQRGTLYALHTDFAIPARAVLERFDGTSWRADATPITSPSRLARLDMAVDPDGVLWVWHEGAPATLWRFDGSVWSTVRLPFDVEATREVPQLAPSLDPFATFLVAPDGALWLFDRDRARLVRLDEAGDIDATRPLDEECTPLVIDRDERVWCRGPVGLLVVSPDGRVVYDAEVAGIPDSIVLSIAVASDAAWLRLERDRAVHLLRFDHREALTPPR
jgi:hypothetical protein